MNKYITINGSGRQAREILIGFQPEQKYAIGERKASPISNKIYAIAPTIARYSDPTNSSAYISVIGIEP